MAHEVREKIVADEMSHGGGLRMAEVVAGFSRALDLAEGEPAGHAMRTCMIGMRLAREIYLLPWQRAGLFYALLLKDLGATSNAATFRKWLGGDDLSARREWRATNRRGPCGRLGYVLRNVERGGSLAARVAGFMKAARRSAAATRQLTEQRGECALRVAKKIGLADETLTAIRHVEAPWDGSSGGPAGEEIPMLARIVTLAQAAEIFYRKGGLQGAINIARERSGRWFDPDLVRAFESTRRDWAFWDSLHEADVTSTLLNFEPPLPDEGYWIADEDDLDRLAEGFGEVVDVKSAWTARHSVGVAEVAVGIAETMGMDGRGLRVLRRAAMLHDLGKVAISSGVLEKPGKLSPPEMIEMRKHAHYTRKLLEKVKGFADIAHIAAGHHERMDGRGYDRGIEAGSLDLQARILAVADTFEALAARRPYRPDLTEGEVVQALEQSAGAGLDPRCVEGLRAFLEGTGYTVSIVAA